TAYNDYFDIEDVKCGVDESSLSDGLGAEVINYVCNICAFPKSNIVSPPVTNPKADDNMDWNERSSYATGLTVAAFGATVVGGAAVENGLENTLLLQLMNWGGFLQNYSSKNLLSLPRLSPS
ncbi:hypothetical protein Tco_0215248, partial [Tanacetum coccineum]